MFAVYDFLFAVLFIFYAIASALALGVLSHPTMLFHARFSFFLSFESVLSR